MKTGRADARRAREGLGTTQTGIFWQENRNGAGKQEGERSETTKNAKNGLKIDQKWRKTAAAR